MSSTGNRELRWNRDIFTLGVTGTPGSGKSTVSQIFAEVGATVIDADREAREVLEAPETSPALMETFGIEIMNREGKPDRRKIADIVFTNPERLKRLNALIHPRVRERFERKASALKPGTVLVCDVPLLFESKMESFFDWIISVSSPERLRMERVRGRGWSQSEFHRRSQRQMSSQQKAARADQILTNDGELSALHEQVHSLYQKIIEARGEQTGF